MLNEIINHHNHLTGSPEVAAMLNNLEGLQLAPQVRSGMRPLLDHLKLSVRETMHDIQASGKQVFIAGPQWCRENADKAGEAHAQVIVDTYGDSYALPNKNPATNTAAIKNGQLDMFLMFDEIKQEPIATACMVLNGGWSEAGRVASKGHVGGRLLQDLRFIQWLIDEESATRSHSVFATLRTAPDRDIGRDKPMRGGQAVCHIWADTPLAMITGFGPLYKKHGSLEQFARMFLTRREISVAEHLFIAHPEHVNFTLEWLRKHGWDNDIPNVQQESADSAAVPLVEAQFAPPESGLTTLVHGDLAVSEKGVRLNEAVQHMSEAGVPFIQFPVSVEEDTLALQNALIGQGFQAFQFTPGITGIEPAKLWFGKKSPDITVVPTFWQADHSISNPFWQDELARHADQIAKRW